MRDSPDRWIVPAKAVRPGETCDVRARRFTPAGSSTTPCRNILTGGGASRPASISLGRTSRLPIQAKPLGPQALYLVLESIHFLRASRIPGFWRIGLAQLFECLLDREFRCFSHGNLISEPTRIISSIECEAYYLNSEL